jgi:uncharacterized damage-inducible protein DinB
MPNTIADYLRKLLEYDGWANRETLLSLKTAVSCPERSLKWMSHIIAAEFLWLKRLGVDARPMAVWPELSLADCEDYCAELTRIWNTFFDQLTPGFLDEKITYTNSLNEPWESRVEDVLTHVAMHSTYHRGQIASDLRANGETPAYTDFIHAVRQDLM